MQERPVDPGVVHLGDQVAGRERERVGRQEVLGVVVAIHRPGQPPAVVVDPEVAIAGETAAAIRGRLEQQPRIAGRPVPDAKRRLVVARVGPLP